MSVWPTRQQRAAQRRQQPLARSHYCTALTLGLVLVVVQVACCLCRWLRCWLHHSGSLRSCTPSRHRRPQCTRPPLIYSGVFVRAPTQGCTIQCLFAVLAPASDSCL